MVTPAQSENHALENVTARLFSDLLVHHMGKRLADDITQGVATGDMFRTTPLWGVGSTAPYGHDGRFPSLFAIVEYNEDHMGKTSQLSPSDRAALVAFLETL